MRITKEKKWKILFSVLLILSILALTYNFEKAPIIYYFIFFFIVECILGNTFKFRKIIPIICICVILILVLYLGVFEYKGKLLSLSQGPISRVLVTQVAALFLHVDAFPNRMDYLNGHSFPEMLVGFLGEGTYDLRSGKIVMSLYRKGAVKQKIANVMNTMFVGEAYANFGIPGVIVAPFVAGIVFSAILAWFMKSKKTPINIILYLEAFRIFINVLQGGFVEFFYNIKLIEIIVLFISIKYIIKFEPIWEKIENLIKIIMDKNFKKKKYYLN